MTLYTHPAIKPPEQVWVQPRVQASRDSELIYNLFDRDSIERIVINAGAKERIVFVKVVESSENDYTSLPPKITFAMTASISQIRRAKPSLFVLNDDDES